MKAIARLDEISYSHLRRVILEMIGGMRYRCICKHAALAMLRRRFASKATEIPIPDIAEAISLVEQRRPLVDVLRTVDADLDDDWVLCDVMRPSIRLAFSDRPPPIGVFRAHVRNLIDKAQSAAKRRSEREERKRTKASPKWSGNVVSFDRARAERMLSSIFEKINALRVSRGEVVDDPPAMDEPGVERCVRLLIRSFEEFRAGDRP